MSLPSIWYSRSAGPGCSNRTCAACPSSGSVTVCCPPSIATWALPALASMLTLTGSKFVAASPTARSPSATSVLSSTRRAVWPHTGHGQRKLTIVIHGDQSPRQLVVQQFDVRVDHQRHKLWKARRRTPAQHALRLRRIATQMVNLRRPEVARIDFDKLLPVEPCPRERKLEELAHRVRLPSRDDKVISLGLLQHQEHGFDIIRRVAP